MVTSAFESFISRFSLKVQIGAIGGIAIAGFLVVGGFFAWTEAAVDRMQVKADMADHAKDAVGDLNVLMLEARRAEKDFIIRRDAKYIARHAEVVKDLEQTFTKLKAAVSTDLHAGIT